MSTTGKAAVFAGAHEPLSVRTFEVVAPADGEVLLRMKRSGICGTDVHIAEGRLKIPPARVILGHEFVGEVDAVGTDAAADGLGAPLAVGDVAIACVAVPCGECVNCARGHSANCLAFGVTYFRDPEEPPHFHGGYAEYLHSPAKNVVKVPDGVGLDAAAAFACAGPTVMHAFGLAGDLDGDELVVVQGCGAVGLFAIAFAASAGCDVVAIASGATPARMELARRLGAREVFDYRATAEEERAKEIRDLAVELGRGDGADVVFEASGSPAAIPEGMRLARTLGRYVVPGQYSDSGPVEIEPHLITFKALKIVGSGQYTIADVGAYLGFLRERPAVQELAASCVSHRYEIDRANEALADVAAGRVVKGVFSA